MATSIVGDARHISQYGLDEMDMGFFRIGRDMGSKTYFLILNDGSRSTVEVTLDPEKVPDFLLNLQVWIEKQ